MSSRATTSLSKIARPFSSTASIGRHSSINGPKAATNAARKQELRADGRSSETQDPTTRSISTRTKTRPVPPAGRTVPLMQTFRTSAPAPAPLSTRTIDCAVLPTLYSLADTSDPASDPVVIRIPLLPGTLAAHGPEPADPPLPAAPEILVVAPLAPEDTASALTEVGGIGVDGVELRFVHEPEPEAPPARGMLKDLWEGLVDDVLGGPQKAKPVV